jgi:nucleotide-binding universal stress UspA family protein
MPRPPLLALPIVATALLAAGGGDEAAERLAKAKSAALALPRLHALVRVVDTDDRGEVSERFVECWVDVPGGRARTEIRTFKKAQPHLVVCGGPELLRFEKLEVGEVAEQRGRYPLPMLLAASFAGELLAATFNGDLVTMKTKSYEKPMVAAGEESVAGETCVRLHFGGNAGADLWIARGDGLPRRVKGRVAGRALDETIVELDSDFKTGDVAFEIPVVDGERPLDPGEAMKRWSSLPAESTLWPAVDEAAPDFAAVDVHGQLHILSELAEEQALLAFWNPEDDDSVAKAAQVERAFDKRGDATLHFIHVAALGRRDPVVKASADHGLAQPIWVAGGHAKNAFRQFRIWTTPVFVKVAERTVTAITSDPEEAQRWFKAH